jgi:hypothetical protein
MKILISKNLISHKTRNKLTAIIFSLTLGTVIFLLTVMNVEIEMQEALENRAGANLYVETNKREKNHLVFIDPKKATPILKNNPNVKSFTYSTDNFTTVTTTPSHRVETDASDLSRINSRGINLSAF